MEDQQSTSRRTVLKGAAWAAPAVAVAVAAPLAAASAGTASTSAFVGGNIVANNAAGTASGAFNGGLNITNVTGSWATGALTGELKLTGPWTSVSITKPGGTAFVVNELLTSTDGTVWRVTSIDADTSGVWGVKFSAESKTVSANTTINLPAAIYSGTFTPGVPTTRSPIAATVSVGAANINGGSLTGNSSPYPA